MKRVLKGIFACLAFFAIQAVILVFCTSPYAMAEEIAVLKPLLPMFIGSPVATSIGFGIWYSAKAS